MGDEFVVGASLPHINLSQRSATPDRTGSCEDIYPLKLVANLPQQRSTGLDILRALYALG
jgi:hypothetical protein